MSRYKKIFLAVLFTISGVVPFSALASTHIHPTVGDPSTLTIDPVPGYSVCFMMGNANQFELSNGLQSNGTFYYTINNYASPAQQPMYFVPTGSGCGAYYGFFWPHNYGGAPDEYALEYTVVYWTGGEWAYSFNKEYPWPIPPPTFAFGTLGASGAAVIASDVGNTFESVRSIVEVVLGLSLTFWLIWSIMMMFRISEVEERLRKRK